MAKKIKYTEEQQTTNRLVSFENYKLLTIDKLVPADWNYKKDEPKKLIKLVENIKRNGQIENVIVRLLDTGFYEVVNGNHRLKAFQELGLEKVICYDLGAISIQQAKRIAIETNETKFSVDTIKLAENIADVLTQYKLDDLELTMPYSKEELENYNKLLTFDFDQYKQQTDGIVQSENETDKTIILVIPKKTFKKFDKKIDALLSEFKDITKQVK